MKITEEAPETLALMTVLALTDRDIEKGKLRPVDEAFKRLRERVRD